MSVSTHVPFTLTRLGTVMSPEPGNENEIEGVLNPASGYGPDGKLYLLPRLVASGNISRVGLAEVIIENGVPVGVERKGVVLEPTRGWERGKHNAGTEDPRTTFVPSLGKHVMTYVAYGPLGPRTALAISDNLHDWERLGPVFFEFDDALSMDLNLFPNKDCLFFPEPVTNPETGELSFAMLHRPMWDLGWIRQGEGTHLPAGLEDDRPGIWISYVPVTEVEKDIRSLVHQSNSRILAMSEYPWESLKIGGGPAPIRIDEGWLLLHHGVSGLIKASAFEQQQAVNYAAGAMILDANDPTVILARTELPLLVPETDEERDGTVPNVVFPTAIEEIDGKLYVFYGMADSSIGVALLERVQS